MDPNERIAKANDLMTFESFSNTKQVSTYLKLITGNDYVITSASDRQWGDESARVEEGLFYQIMPYGSDGGFFDWYCDTRLYHQFFRTIDAAVIHFVYYWHLWRTVNK